MNSMEMVGAVLDSIMEEVVQPEEMARPVQPTVAARRADDDALRAMPNRGILWVTGRGGRRLIQAPMVQDIRLAQGAQSLELVAERAEQAPAAQFVVPVLATQAGQAGPDDQPAAPAPAVAVQLPEQAMAVQPAIPDPVVQPQVVYIERVVVMAEPYYNWRDQLSALFRNLTPEKEAGSQRFKGGYVAKVVYPPSPHDAYFIIARYNINTSQGVQVSSWKAAVESLVRNMTAIVTRERTGEATPFDSGREKARCGIAIRVALKPLHSAAGF